MRKQKCMLFDRKRKKKKKCVLFSVFTFNRTLQSLFINIENKCQCTLSRQFRRCLRYNEIIKSNTHPRLNKDKNQNINENNLPKHICMTVIYSITLSLQIQKSIKYIELILFLLTLSILVCFVYFFFNFTTILWKS